MERRKSEVVPEKKWQGSDPQMSEEEVRAERTFSLRKIDYDHAQIIALALRAAKKTGGSHA